MNKLFSIILFCSLFFSCGKSTPNPLGVSDLVTGDLPFEVTFIPCDDRDNPLCEAKPVVDATIQIFKIEENLNEPRFIAEDKTNNEGKLNFFHVPLGSYQANVSTNEYGDTIVGADAYSGRTSEIRVKFY